MEDRITFLRNNYDMLNDAAKKEYQISVKENRITFLRNNYNMLNDAAKKEYQTFVKENKLDWALENLNNFIDELNENRDSNLPPLNRIKGYGTYINPFRDEKK